MLVLSRQKDESIMVGDNVEITIVEEVYDAIQREKEDLSSEKEAVEKKATEEKQEG
jgi:sRNA-binding carbon storage regulator CsrA